MLQNVFHRVFWSNTFDALVWARLTTDECSCCFPWAAGRVSALISVLVDFFMARCNKCECSFTLEVFFTLVTRGRFFLRSASKFDTEANGEIFDVSPENDLASPNVETP